MPVLWVTVTILLQMDFPRGASWNISFAEDTNTGGEPEVVRPGIRPIPYLTIDHTF